MLINADCTVYEKGSFTRHVIPGVYWNDSRGATVSRNGVQISDSLIVYIYDSEYAPRPGDIIVKGAVDFEWDSTTQQTASASKRQFEELYPDFAAVRTVSDCRYGGLPHIEVNAR